MKRQIILFSICLAFAGPAFAGVRAERSDNNLTSDLVGYWPFDGADFNSASTVTYDRSVQGNNGTMAGPPLKVIGKLGQALSFDGDDYVNVNDADNLELTNELTLAAWIRPAVEGSSGFIVAKETSGCKGYSMMLWGGQINLMFAGSCWDQLGNLTYPANEWTHVAWTKSGVNSVLYKNGAIDKTWGDTTETTVASDVALRIGDSIRDGNYKFNGGIDDVRVYSRALGADEIKRLYNMGAAGLRAAAPQQAQLTTDLIAYWSFDEPDISDTTVIDRSIQNHNGTMVSSPLKIIGKLGQALSFDGSNSYVDSSNFADNLANFSVSVWFKSSDTNSSGWPAIVSKMTSGSLDTGTGWGLYLHAFEGEIGNTFAIIATDGGNWVSKQMLTAKYNDNAWHHAVMAVSGGDTVDLYMDGSLAGTPYNGGSMSSYSNSVKVRVGRDYSARRLKSVIDDVRIYNRTLGADEVKRLYNMGGGLRSAAPQQGQLTTDLIAYWPFNGPDISGTTVIDRSSQNHNGTMVNSPLKIIGKLGQALSFNGSSSYLDSSNFADNLSDFTVAAWFKTSATPAGYGGAIVSKTGSGGIYSGRGWMILLTGPSSGAGATHVMGQIQTDASNWVGKFTSAAYNDNSWHHATMVFTGGNTLTLYLDGSTGGTNDFSGGSIGSYSNASKVRVGNDDDGEYFSGAVDDVRIYNRALGADEVKRLYNMGR